ncbi:MAG: hypothetical protein COT84_08075 [Chlamydiae bacterium CG10_big_fil_rev_8_21_14_0_10_35_9]|nr:MAG: hypothetical protein COT84_08075 [Chlamydiae bacterium CG10_big_fil_rev_8_21_14_0_10_35_9]
MTLPAVQSTVHTLGDSTLDNLYWLLEGDGSNLQEAIENSTEGQIQEKLGDQYQVVSHAYDGFTTEDVLGLRLRPVGSVLPSWGIKFQTYIDHKCPGFYRQVHPLQQLKKALPLEGNHYVVISVGGNDFRENLSNPFRLIKDISKVQGRYLEIVEKVQRLSTENRRVYPILMFQYRTDANHDVYGIYKLFGVVGTVAFAVNTLCTALIAAPAVHTSSLSKVSKAVCSAIGSFGLYLSNKAVPLSVSRDIISLKKPSMSLFGALLQKFYHPMLAKAREDRIPVLDLPNTFNPYEDLYESGIEPNANGSKLIAEGIAHIVQNHDFEGTGRIYAKRDENYTSLPITKGWTVEYPEQS